MIFPELCQKDLYFRDGVLLSEQEVKETIATNVRIKEKQMLDYIIKNNLTPLSKFSNLDNSKFKIFMDPRGNEFYSINYEFVEETKVSAQIQEHRREVQNKKIAEEKRLLLEQQQKERRLLLEQQQEQTRIRIQQENERQRLIEVERTRRIEAELKRLEQERIYQERRNNPFK